MIVLVIAWMVGFVVVAPRPVPKGLYGSPAVVEHAGKPGEPEKIR